MGAPLRLRIGLAGYAIGRPTELAILGTKSKKGTFGNKARPAGRGIIVIVLKHIPEGGENLLIAVAVPVAHNFHVFPIGIDTTGKSGHPDMPVIAFLPGKGGGVKIPSHLRSTFIVVKATHIKSPA